MTARRASVEVPALGEDPPEPDPRVPVRGVLLERLPVALLGGLQIARLLLGFGLLGHQLGLRRQELVDERVDLLLRDTRR